MVLRVDESKLYSTAYRGRVLDELTAALMEDGRIAGAILVGSGAARFKDRYSDIDLAVLVGDEAKVDEVYADWWRRIHALFPIVDAFKEQPRHLYGFLLDRFLELDVGFQGEAFPRSLDPAELLRALKATVDVYYGEAENLDVKLGMDRAPRLRAAMSEYLSAFSPGQAAT